MDTYKTIKCPQCGKTMKKFFIPTAGVSIDICTDGCGGIYFDNQELNHFEGGSQSNIEELNKYLSGKTFVPQEVKEGLRCPACSTNMVKQNYRGLNIQVDTCYACGGIFLTHGKLEQIRSRISGSSSKSRTQHYKTSNEQIRSTFKPELDERERFFGEDDSYNCFPSLNFLLRELIRAFRL